MKRFIELKHVKAKDHVRGLLEELMDRLEHKLRHFTADAVSLHVLFEENGRHALFRAAVTCHVPGHTVAAHEEQRSPGAAIRRAFAELERQLEKRKATRRHERLLRRSKRHRPGVRDGMLLATLLLAGSCVTPRVCAGEPGPTDQRAKDAIALLESNDPYQRQVGFLRLEALRDPSTVGAIRPSLTARDPERRAEAVRALAAIQGAQAVPQLLDILHADQHPQVRRAALLGLEPLARANPEILPAFIAALRDRKPEVRMTAVDIVSRIDDPRARAAIRARNRRERDRNVRRVLAPAMARLGDR